MSGSPKSLDEWQRLAQWMSHWVANHHYEVYSEMVSHMPGWRDFHGYQKAKPKPFLRVDLMSDAPNDIDYINLNDINLAPDTIPPAEYHVKIVEADVRENKAKDGFYVNYRAVVQSGPHAGFSVFAMWSLKNTAAWRLKKDFRAMEYDPPNGVPHLADLIGFEGIAKVKDDIRKDKDTGEPTGEKKSTIDRWIGPLK